MTALTAAISPDGTVGNSGCPNSINAYTFASDACETGVLTYATVADLNPVPPQVSTPGVISNGGLPFIRQKVSIYTGAPCGQGYYEAGITYFAPNDYVNYGGTLYNGNQPWLTFDWQNIYGYEASGIHELYPTNTPLLVDLWWFQGTDNFGWGFNGQTPSQAMNVANLGAGGGCQNEVGSFLATAPSDPLSNFTVQTQNFTPIQAYPVSGGVITNWNSFVINSGCSITSPPCLYGAYYNSNSYWSDGLNP